MTRLWRRWRVTVGMTIIVGCLALSLTASRDPGNARWLVETADVFRVLAILGSSVLIGMVCAICLRMRPSLSTWQAARFAGIPFACLGIIGTEIEHFHDEVTYRLPLFVAFLALELYGVAAMRLGRDRLPDPVRK